MKAWRLVVFGVGVAVSFCSICPADSLIGKKAPAVTIRKWITQNPPEIKDLAGKPWCIEFWATWCPPCVENVPNLNRLNQKYRTWGLEIIAISQDKSSEAVRRFVHEKKINYHVAIDNGTSNWYEIKGYPTIIVIDHLGLVVWQGYPWNSGFDKAISKVIEETPTPLLLDVDLGPFDYLKKDLYGGKNFAEAYYKIKSKATNHQKTKNPGTAKRIIKIIGKRIAQKISQAEQLRATDPVGACRLYADIIAKYSGIEAVESAKAVYLELKKYIESENQPLIANKVTE